MAVTYENMMRCKKLVLFNGEPFTRGDLAKRFGISFETLSYRLDSGMTAEEAVLINTASISEKKLSKIEKKYMEDKPYIVTQGKRGHKKGVSFGDHKKGWRWRDKKGKEKYMRTILEVEAKKEEKKAERRKRTERLRAEGKLFNNGAIFADQVLSNNEVIYDDTYNPDVNS